MPLFNYRSDDGEVIEELVRQGEQRPDEIKRDGKTYKYVVGAPSDPRFRGKGFYATDY